MPALKIGIDPSEMFEAVVDASFVLVARLHQTPFLTARPRCLTGRGDPHPPYSQGAHEVGGGFSARLSDLDNVCFRSWHHDLDGRLW
jgi:hypothetical protein